MGGAIAVQERKRGYHTLDALRGVAAIGVVMYHYPALLAPLRVDGAYLAVDLFFLMSGFVIAHAYERRFDAGLSPGTFMAMRVCRLYPLYAIGTLISVGGIAAGLVAHAALVWNWGSLATATATSAAFLPSPPIPGKPADLYPLNMPAWSLFFELAVNAAFAWTYPRVRGGVLAAVILAGALAVAAVAIVAGRLDGGVQYATALAGAARVTFSFFLGVALCRLERGGTLSAPRLPAPLLIAIAAASLAAAPPLAWRWLYDATCVLLLFPALIWCAVHTEPRRGIAACTVLGVISYPLYVIHIPIQLTIMGVVHKAFGGDPRGYAPGLGLAVIAALLAASWLLARYVDPPLRAALEAVVLRGRGASRRRSIVG